MMSEQHDGASGSTSATAAYPGYNVDSGGVEQQGGSGGGAPPKEYALGLSLPDIIYGFLLLLSNISGMLAFSIMSSAKVKSGGAGFSMAYGDFTATEFSLFAGVLLWLWTLAVAALAVATQLFGSDHFALSPSVKTALSRGNAVVVVFGYSGAVACASFSDSCRNHNYASIPRYDDDDVAKDIAVFCNKVSASCTFLWFALLAFGSALVLKSYVDHKENFADAGADYKQFGFGQSPFQSAQHDAGAGAPPPPSAGYNADHRTSHDAEAGQVGVSEAEGNRNSFASSQQNVVSSADL